MRTENDKSNALVILTDFERRLAACTTLGEAKQMRDEAEALRYYAKVMQAGIVVQNRCAMARYLAERKLGEMLARLPRAPGPGRGKKISAGAESFLKKLEAAGLDYDDARWWQRLARVPQSWLRDQLASYFRTGAGELNPGYVEMLVDRYISEHPTEAEKARAERADERRLARWDAEDAEVEARRSNSNAATTLGFWAEIGDGFGFAHGALMRLQEHLAVGDVRAIVDHMLAQVEQLDRERYRQEEAARKALTTAATTAP